MMRKLQTVLEIFFADRDFPSTFAAHRIRGVR